MAVDARKESDRTPEQAAQDVLASARERREQGVLDGLTSLLKQHNCSIVPAVHIVGNRVESTLEIRANG